MFFRLCTHVLAILTQQKYLLALNLCFSGFVPMVCLYLCNRSIYWLWICIFQALYPWSVYTYATEVFIGFQLVFFRLCTHVLSILMQQKYLLALNLCFSGFVPMVCLYLCNRSIYWLSTCVFQALYPCSVYIYATEVLFGFKFEFFRLCTHVLSILMQQKYLLALNLCFSGFLPMFCLYLCNRSTFWLWTWAFERAAAGLLVHSSLMKSRKGLAHDVMYTPATHAGLGHDIADTDCQTD